jgi:hypothetical protein
MTKTSTEITTELVGDSYLPKENTFIRKTFPRISFTSQDKTEGKGKTMKVVEEAGTFFLEKPTDETDDKNKKIWSHVEIGKSLEGIIFFTRKKLSYYDQPNNAFISSSYFDQDTDEIVLWSAGKQIAKGTKAQLQAPYMFKKEDGKASCKLAENKVLYVLYQGEVYELTVKGTSMYSYSSYYKECNGEPNKNLTLMTPEDCENGSISWSKIIYKRVRQLTQDEWDTTRELAKEMIEGIAEEKAYFASMDTNIPTTSDNSMNINDWNPNLPPVNVPILGDGVEM